LTTQLGTACSKAIHDGQHGVMVAIKGGQAVPVPLADIVGKRRTVPADHSWIKTARDVGVCLGDA